MQLAARCRSVQRCNIGIFRRLVWCGQPEKPSARVRSLPGDRAKVRSGWGGAGGSGVGRGLMEWGGVRWGEVGQSRTGWGGTMGHERCHQTHVVSSVYS